MSEWKEFKGTIEQRRLHIQSLGSVDALLYVRSGEEWQVARYDANTSEQLGHYTFWIVGCDEPCYLSEFDEIGPLVEIPTREPKDQTTAEKLQSLAKSAAPKAK